LTIYVVDMDDDRANSGAIGAEWKRSMSDGLSGEAGIGVARLSDKEALV
jgi:hypothetical protein